MTTGNPNTSQTVLDPSDILNQPHFQLSPVSREPSFPLSDWQVSEIPKSGLATMAEPPPQPKFRKSLRRWKISHVSRLARRSLSCLTSRGVDSGHCPGLKDRTRFDSGVR